MPAPSRLFALLLALLAPLFAGCGAGGILDELAGGSSDSGPGPLPPGGGAAAMSDAERAFAMEVLALVNVERAKVPVPALQWDEPAAAVAFGHSVDMDQRSFFSHNNPSGQDPGARMAAAGMTGFGAWGENIARGQRTPASVMSDWMGSQGHRENILRSYFTHLGIGVHSTSDIWWTQLFLSR